MALTRVRVKLPAVVAALQILAIEPTAGKRHSPVRAGIAQSESLPLTIAADHERHFQQHRFVQTVAWHLRAGQGAIPEAVKHQRIRRLP